jgi:DNA-binding NtrC family response regulator
MVDGTEKQQAAPPAEAIPSASEPPTLLVIDDDTVHRMIICKVASRAGFVATGAASYEEAVKLLGEHSYTAVTLDLSLGQHGGVDVLHFIAAMDYEMPVIIVSGSGEDIRNESMSVAHLLSVNVCRTLPKPVDLAQLRLILTDFKDRSAVGLSPCPNMAF